MGKGVWKCDSGAACGKRFATRRGWAQHVAKAHRAPAVKAREWWLACDGFDRFYTAYDSYEAAKTGRTMTPIHVREVSQDAENLMKGNE